MRHQGAGCNVIAMKPSRLERLMFLLSLVSLLPGVWSLGTRLVLFREPRSSYVERYLTRLRADGARYNHDFAGFTDPALANGADVAPPLPPSGFSERTVRVKLGHGRALYLRARAALLDWRMHEGSPWARIALGGDEDCSSSRNHHQVYMATIAKSCAGAAWVVNPCGVLYQRRHADLFFHEAPRGSDSSAPANVSPGGRRRPINRDPGSSNGIDAFWSGGAPDDAPQWATFSKGPRKHRGKQSAVAYATKRGHLFQGEERMRVLWFSGRGGDDSVWFEVYSVSRGAGVMGKLVLPLARSMQRRFFEEQARTIQAISMHGGSP